LLHLRDCATIAGKFISGDLSNAKHAWL
jgi:hypothetical protein